MDQDYRDTLPLSAAIRDTYDDGLSDGQDYLPLDHENRDYAMRRADALEAEIARLRRAVTV